MWWFPVCFAGPAVEREPLIVEPGGPTTLGVRLGLSGDDPEAAATLEVRRPGEPWRTALPPHRVRPEHAPGGAAVAEFAGSIFDLVPDTAYELRMVVTDGEGRQTEALAEAATAGVRVDPAPIRQVDVTSTAQLEAALADARPGDRILVRDGTYVGGWWDLDASGTAAAPIVIEGESADGTVLDGGGCTLCSVLDVFGSHVRIRSLTLRNGLHGLRFRGEGATGNVASRLRVEGVVTGIAGEDEQADFTICDNVLEGPYAWPGGDEGGLASVVQAIGVRGAGHIVCHNTVAGWGTGIRVGEGARSVDIFGNDLASILVEGVTLDGVTGNVRVVRNRLTNVGTPVSLAGIDGGPVYSLRNVVANPLDDQLGLRDGSSGVYALHGTYLSAGEALRSFDTSTTNDFLVAGNLFVGGNAEATVTWEGGVNRGWFDGNGWWPDGRFSWSRLGAWPSFDALAAAGGFEARGVLLEGPPLAAAILPGDPLDPVFRPSPVLRAGSLAVDAATPLPNITDTSFGAGPDLGAHELGCPEPGYGPRETDDYTQPCPQPVGDPDLDATEDADTGTASDGLTDQDAGGAGRGRPPPPALGWGCDHGPAPGWLGWVGGLGGLGGLRRRDPSVSGGRREPRVTGP